MFDASLGMIVDIQTRRLRTIEQLRAFVEGNEAVDFRPRDRGEAYGFARATLERFGYRRLGKRDKGVVLRFLVAATGISRQQMERLVRQWRDTCIEDPDVIATILEHIRATTRTNHRNGEHHHCAPSIPTPQELELISHIDASMHSRCRETDCLKVILVERVIDCETNPKTIIDIV